MSAPQLKGLVLVGGKSSRMGRAKAYLDFGNGPQWRAAGAALQSVCQNVYYSVSPQLEPSLPPQIPLISDIFCTPIGPVGGIMSAFKADPEAAYFVVACDTPYFNAEAAQFLVSHRNPYKKATVFVTDGKVEPLLAIYEPAIFAELALAWTKGRYCPRAILSELDIERVEPVDTSWTININHAHEIVQCTNDIAQKTITVQYYAALREQVGRSAETVLTSTHTVGELFAELKQRYGLLMDAHALRYAHNDRLVTSVEAINSGDVVVFIPPVSGG